MDIGKAIRKIARSDKHQTLYNQSKELGNIRLFYNDIDLTALQILYLNWLSIYNSLYRDLAMGEDYISMEVIKDDMRTDAYLYYRQKNRKKKLNKNNNTNNKTKDNSLPGVKFY